MQLKTVKNTMLISKIYSRPGDHKQVYTVVQRSPQHVGQSLLSRTVWSMEDASLAPTPLCR